MRLGKTGNLTVNGINDVQGETRRVLENFSGVGLVEGRNGGPQSDAGGDCTIQKIMGDLNVGRKGADAQIGDMTGYGPGRGGQNSARSYGKREGGNSWVVGYPLAAIGKSSLGGGVGVGAGRENRAIDRVLGSRPAEFGRVLQPLSTLRENGFRLNSDGSGQKSEIRSVSPMVLRTRVYDSTEYTRIQNLSHEKSRGISPRILRANNGPVPGLPSKTPNILSGIKPKPSSSTKKIETRIKHTQDHPQGNPHETGPTSGRKLIASTNENVYNPQPAPQGSHYYRRISQEEYLRQCNENQTSGQILSQHRQINGQSSGSKTRNILTNPEYPLGSIMRNRSTENRRDLNVNNYARDSQEKPAGSRRNILG